MACDGKGVILFGQDEKDETVSELGKEWSRDVHGVGHGYHLLHAVDSSRIRQEREREKLRPRNPRTPVPLILVRHMMQGQAQLATQDLRIDGGSGGGERAASSLTGECTAETCGALLSATGSVARNEGGLWTGGRRERQPK